MSKRDIVKKISKSPKRSKVKTKISKPHKITLTAREPGDVDRRSFPLTTGLPFARGVLWPGDPVAILDQAGKAQPLQTRVMERHDDGSVRWLLVDYRADFQAMQTTSHTLVLGKKSPEASDGQRIETKQQGDLLVVDNGVLKLEIDRQACRPLLKVWREGRLVSEDGLDFWVTAEDGAKFLARNDSQVSFGIEEQGPLRLLMVWKGTHKDENGRGHFGFEVRLTVYAGQPFVRIEHVFINRLDPAVLKIKELVARLAITVGQGPGYTLSGNQYHHSAHNADWLTTDKPARVEQHHIYKYRYVGQDGQVISEVGNNNQGWAAVSGSDHTVLLAVKNFWQNYPKAIAAYSEALEFYLIPDRGKGFEVARGMSKTHTFFLCFQQGKVPGAELNDMGFALSRWPMPAAPSEHYKDSGEFWEFFPYYPKKYPQLEIGLKNLLQPAHAIVVEGAPTPASGRAFGLKNFGDFAVVPKYFGHTDTNWEAPDRYYMNNAYDTPFMLLMMFLRDKNPALWWEGEACALHMMDVDTCYHGLPIPGRPDTEHMVGAAYMQCYQHIGGVQTPGATNYEPASALLTFTQGLVAYYHLTGDQRVLETAIGLADFMAYMAQKHKWGINRNAGWCLTTLGTVHKIRPHPEYVKGAKALLDSITTDFDELCGKNLSADHAPHSKVTYDRHINLCQRGLIQWHQVTADERTERLILGLADEFIKTCIGEEGMAMMSNWPEHCAPFMPVQGFANLDALAYAYKLSGKKKYVQAGIAALCLAVKWINTFQDQGDGENFIRPLRGMFPFFDLAHRLRLMEKVPGAGGWLNR